MELVFSFNRGGRVKLLKPGRESSLEVIPVHRVEVFERRRSALANRKFHNRDYEEVISKRGPQGWVYVAGDNRIGATVQSPYIVRLGPAAARGLQSGGRASSML